MTVTAMIFMMAAAALQPWETSPQALESAMTQALDTLSISRQQLDFDRHWATGAVLVDSTVLQAIQNVESIPGILERHLRDLRSISDVRGEERGMDALVELLSLMEQADREAASVMDSIGREGIDSLLAVVPALWSGEEDDSSWMDYLTGRNMDTLPDAEIPMDTLASMMKRFPVIQGLDPHRILSCAMDLNDAQWPEELEVTLPGVTGTTVSFSFEGPVRWVVGGRGRNVYSSECPFELIIDLGGDDSYGDGIGGALGPGGRRVALVIDLQGDDLWSSSQPVSQGAAVMGSAGIVDLGGNDTYIGRELSQGAGCMGSGFFMDLQGDDYSRGGSFSQGAGCLGRGLYFDGGGDDFRQVDLFGQGFGGPAGRGELLDAGGNDCNLAGFTYSHEPLLPDDNQAMSQGFAMGIRPLIAGGVGLMADLGSGNDTYRAEVFGQGCAYFYGLGMLYDESGQDVYSAAQYSQGTGIHLASGCLWDGDGDDSYFSRNGPAQGSAHDLSTGYLLDGGGSDWFCSDGGQSLSLTNSSTIFVDLEGNDTYSARGGGQGEARWARGSSGAAVFLDLADLDVYSGTGADSSRWLGREYGCGVDLPAITPGGLITQDPTGEPEELDLDSLFSVASEWGVGPNRERVSAHRDELSRRGGDAVRYLVENHMGTLSGLESRAMERVFRDNADVSLELLVPMLGIIDSLNRREGGNLVYFLGKMEDDRAREPLERFISSRVDSLSPGLRTGVIRSLGYIGDPASLSVIHSMAEDSSERVRRECAVSMGKIHHPSSLVVLEILSRDPFLDVRSAAERAIELVEETANVPEEGDEDE